MLSATTLQFLSQRGVTNLAQWARLAGVDPTVLHQARHHEGRIAENHARALGRVIDADVATVRAVLCGSVAADARPSLVTKAARR